MSKHIHLTLTDDLHDMLELWAHSRGLTNIQQLMIKILSDWVDEGLPDDTSVKEYLEKRRG